MLFSFKTNRECKNIINYHTIIIQDPNSSLPKFAKSNRANYPLFISPTSKITSKFVIILAMYLLYGMQ